MGYLATVLQDGSASGSIVCALAPVMLGAALKQDVHLIALHLTRPPITELDRRGLNVKVVAAISPELFKLQPQAYRDEVLSPADRLDAMAITNGARRLMHDWLDNKVAEAYTLSSDWDDRWRTGGTVDELLDEARLSPAWLLKGIERFVAERPQRLAAIRAALEGA